MKKDYASWQQEVLRYVRFRPDHKAITLVFAEGASSLWNRAMGQLKWAEVRHPFQDWVLRLGEIAEYWYRTPIGESSYSLNHAELPVTVTLYDEGGKTVDTLSLTVSTYDLHSWY